MIILLLTIVAAWILLGIGLQVFAVVLRVVITASNKLFLGE